MVNTILIQSFVMQYYNPLINEVNFCLKRMTRTVQHIIIVPMINTRNCDELPESSQRAPRELSSPSYQKQQTNRVLNMVNRHLGDA